MPGRPAPGYKALAQPRTAARGLPESGVAGTRRRAAVTQRSSRDSGAPAKLRTGVAEAESPGPAPPHGGRLAQASARGRAGPGAGGRPGTGRGRDASGSARGLGSCPSGRGGRGAALAAKRMRAAERLPLPPRPPLPPPPPPPLHPRRSPSLLARWVLKLGGWQQTGSARGPSHPAPLPWTHRRAAHISRRPGKTLPPNRAVLSK